MVDGGNKMLYLSWIAHYIPQYPQFGKSDKSQQLALHATGIKTTRAKSKISLGTDPFWNWLEWPSRRVD